jgi:hypothetical protein
MHKIIVFCQRTMYLPRQSFFLCASDGQQSVCVFQPLFLVSVLSMLFDT